MENALQVMPRTHHRLLIFKHRIITNAKLNKPYQFDLGKFRDENESLLSQMWFKVATYANGKIDKQSAYVNSIEVLSESCNIYQKIDFMIEYSQWLFSNEYPRKEAREILLKAISLLLDREEEIDREICMMNLKDGPFQNVKDVKEIEILMRLHIILATMCKPHEDQYKENLLLSTYFVQQMLKVSTLKKEKTAVRESRWKVNLWFSHLHDRIC